MLRRATRVLVTIAAGAGLTVAALVARYPTRAAVVIDLDRDPPAFTSGFHPAERDRDLTFAWVSGRAVVRLAGIDRRRSWSCTARVRGARADGQPQPDITLAADGVEVHALATNDFTDLRLEVPARDDASGLTVTLASTPTFVPGPHDRRELGAQIDRLVCAPAPGFLRPPTPAIAAAIAAGATFAGAIVLGAFSWPWTVAALVAWAVAHAVLLTTGDGALGAYPALVQTVALSGALAAVMAIGVGARVFRRPMTAPARAAIMIATGAFALLLSALSHPAKDLVDAVFQAHRLEWVIGGRYFFTQPLPDGVSFPYAIGLYVTAAPWAALTRDHVWLLRVVVLASHAAASLVLYPLIARFWDDRRAAVAAVALSLVVPLTFVVIGNANWPNAFAQSVALAAMAALVVSGEAGWRWSGPAAFLAFATLAILSHVSTLALLVGTAGCVLVTLFVWGGVVGRGAAVRLAVALAIACGLAVGVYYRHFPEVYARALSRVRATAPAPAPAAPNEPTRPELERPLSWPERASGTVRETVANVGWPLVLLAGAGLFVLRRERRTDALSVVLVGWCGAWLVLLVASTLTSVDVAYQRYALEFIGRVNLAGYPVAVLLAARAAGWAWRPGAPRVATVGVSLGVVAALVLGASSWYAWFGPRS